MKFVQGVTDYVELLNIKTEVDDTESVSSTSGSSMSGDSIGRTERRKRKLEDLEEHYRIMHGAVKKILDETHKLKTHKLKRKPIFKLPV